MMIHHRSYIMAVIIMNHHSCHHQSSSIICHITYASTGPKILHHHQGLHHQVKALSLSSSRAHPGSNHQVIIVMYIIRIRHHIIMGSISIKGYIIIRILNHEQSSCISSRPIINRYHIISTNITNWMKQTDPVDLATNC